MEHVRHDFHPGEQPRKQSFKIPVIMEDKPFALTLRSERAGGWTLDQRPMYSFRWSTAAEESFAERKYSEVGA